MNEILNSDALKLLRKQRGWSQSDLADKAHISTVQISRWERGESLDVRQHSRDMLTKTFNVPWTQLVTQPQENSHANPISRTVKLTASVKPETRTSLEMVQKMYGVNRATIIELAPLLFLITAQGSLDNRKKNIEKINEMIEETKNRSKEMAPHLADSFDYLATGGDWAEGGPFLDHDISNEKYSIENKEVFGPFDFSERHASDLDPYVNYLKKLVTELPAGLVDDVSTCWKGGSPEYRLSRSFLTKITGIEEKTDAEHKLLTHIENGDINLRELLSQKENLSVTEYQDWLATKLEQAETEKAERSARERELFLKLGYTAFMDEIHKETMQDTDVSMGEEL